MTFLQFKFFSLKHRKPSALVILLIAAETLAFSENVNYSTAGCDCRVMLRHSADAAACLSLID